MLREAPGFAEVQKYEVRAPLGAFQGHMIFLLNKGRGSRATKCVEKNPQLVALKTANSVVAEGEVSVGWRGALMPSS